jgi:hypothetical protein
VQEVHVHVGPVVAEEIGETEEGVVFAHVEQEHCHYVAHALDYR